MLRIGEASTFLGVSQTSLRRWDNMDVFSAYRTIGGHRRYKLSDLERYYNHSDEHQTDTFSAMRGFLDINRRKKVIYNDK
ncbi:MAG: helix-turn-helix domain-containing protein [Promethearchaeota archaeon]